MNASVSPLYAHESVLDWNSFEENNRVNKIEVDSSFSNISSGSLNFTPCFHSRPIRTEDEAQCLEAMANRESVNPSEDEQAALILASLNRRSPLVSISSNVMRVQPLQVVKRKRSTRVSSPSVKKLTHKKLTKKKLAAIKNLIHSCFDSKLPHKSINKFVANVELFKNIHDQVLNNYNLPREDIVEKVVGVLTEVKNMDLSSVDTITDQEVLGIITKMPNLETFNISNCKNLDKDLFMGTIPRELKQLKVINITGCNNIKKFHILEFNKRLPDCEVISQRFPPALQPAGFETL